MTNDIKTGIGYVIPAGALVGFVMSLLAGHYLLSVFFAVAGILIWFLYTIVMDTPLPSVLGNMIMLFGLLLAIGVFMTYGWEQNMFGGYEIRSEGSIFALIILFFSVLAGVLFNRSKEPAAKTESAALSDREKELVRKALKETEGEGPEHKVIVVKAETPAEDEEEEEEEYDYERYGLYPYPPEYYDEDYDEDEEEFEEEEEEEED